MYLIKMEYKSVFGFLVVTSLIFLEIHHLVDGVIVDGDKKKELSATKKQSDEKSMIDSFNTKTCGISDPNFEEHEFVNMAREGQFPWIVSFQVQVPKETSMDVQKKVANKPINGTRESTGKAITDLHFCCGSFISDNWILSAAHCFAPESIKNYLENDKLKVVAGSHKVSSRSPINRNLTIERIYYHSHFDKSMPVGFDIALVELKDKVEFKQKRNVSKVGEQSEPFMNTICLPLKDRKYKFNETVRIAGWGLSSEKDESSMPSKLLTTDILISNKDECVKNYSKSLKSDRPRIQKDKYDDFICASYKNSRDACQSDSGGPLMQFADGKAVVVGVVSYGIGCAKKGVPGLYTRTSAYINWIKDITRSGKRASVEFKLIEAKATPSNKRSNSAKATSTTSTQRPSSSSSSSPVPASIHLSGSAAQKSVTSSAKPVLASSGANTSTTKKSSSFKFFDE